MWKYQGGETGDRWWPGVPARDMTDEEMAAARDVAGPDFDPEASGLYEHMADREHPRLAARAEKAAEAHAEATDGSTE